MASESRSPTTNTMASASLLTVPLEIIYQITDKLSYASQFALSLTCRELYYKVDAPRQPYTPPGENKKPYIMDDLLEIENLTHLPRALLQSRCSSSAIHSTKATWREQEALHYG
ncbi:hypothetical protein V498_00024 [Pseudogymnoascus sp. VKM F-4517 (FW-2822)]|nr:hypothetical protein V498_00024 [Pseudogymnoascus sp. VKM F-4517 (FW-2822)]